jgi:PAS domain-containing protein
MRLAGRDADRALLGLRLPQFVAGQDADARLLRPDGRSVRVRVVRWPLPGTELTAVVLVELDAALSAGAAPVVDPRWTSELERLAKVGTWTFDLATSALERSETLDELYRSVGVDPDGGSVPLEGEQVTQLCRRLRSGTRTDDHHLELQLPGDRLLSCRAEVERAADGTPTRLVGVVHDISAERIAQRMVERSGQRFADLMALLPGGVALLDSTGRVVDANAGLGRLLDVPVERLRGMAATALSADEPADGVGAAGLGGPAKLPGWLRPVPPGARHGYRVDAVPLVRGDGTTVWCEVSVSATSADDGGWFWLVVCTDISDRRRAAELLRSAGTVDELTRLPNRAACLEMVDRLLAGLRETGSRWCAATSTTSRASTPLWATRQATTCWSRWPGGCSGTCLPGARPRGSAPTSSW